MTIIQTLILAFALWILPMLAYKVIEIKIHNIRKAKQKQQDTELQFQKWQTKINLF